MENTSTTSEKLFIGFSVLTIISGLLLAFQHDNFIGLAGSAVGVWLVVDNSKKLIAKSNNLK